ncbi:MULTISPECIES: hypothetical protein [Vibrio]|uniref:hypothetical protein n=1 Tax=Vibrio TaxID=662 RepID=UPI001BD1E46C|nr:MULTISPECIES: hypothetical protein [Vibrio]EIO9263345.1 hypothetical protein [Vibrio alginolyticus]ELB2946339.1 hypothetical protein [Vibrio alginolyticus]MBS9938029.1 hypothetical protein [Vibrio alginolyticus]MCA2468712.1 hypothetical protein [Vibrio alginolyticus]MDW1566270.1 hypothetical protein [Vibrio sp. YT-15]
MTTSTLPETPAQLEAFQTATTESYKLFNEIIREEISAQGVTFESIINQSIVFPLYKHEKEQMEGSVLYINPLLNVNEMGLYLIWSPVGTPVNGKMIFKCSYAGKGWAKDRIAIHEKKKLVELGYLITFYQCENRIAKYMEQLLMDFYNFEYNKSENRGNIDLYLIQESHVMTFGNQAYSDLAIDRHTSSKDVNSSIEDFLNDEQTQAAYLEEYLEMTRNTRLS